MKFQQLLGQSAVSALIRGLGLILSLLLNVIMARALGPGNYGVYAFALSVVALLSIPVKFGLPLHVARETARASATGDHATIWALWAWAHRLIILTGVVVMICLAGWLEITDQNEPSTFQLWFWVGLLIPILSLADLRAAAIRGLGYALFSQIPEIILRPAVTIALALIILAAIEPDFSPENAIMLNVIGSATAFAVGVGFMFWLAPPRPPRATWPNDVALKRNWLISMLTLGMALGAQTLGGNMDVIMLGFLRTDAEVGIYRMALITGSLLGFGLQSINAIILPRVATLYRKGNLMELRILLRHTSRISLALTSVIFLMLIIGGKWIIVNLFGSGYEAAYPALLIIGAGQLISAICGSVMLLINMTGNENAALRGTIGFALANIGLNSILIPPFGPEGAAAATAVSLIILNIYLWNIAWRRLGLNTLPFGPIMPTKERHQNE